MTRALAVAVLIAAVAVLVLVLRGADSEVDQLDDVFTETAGCGTDRETVDSNDIPSWIGRHQDWQRFARYLDRTEPELTVISCKDSGPAALYFEFASRDEVRGAARAYRDDRRFCLLDNALFEVVGWARTFLPDYCDELGGRLRGGS